MEFQKIVIIRSDNNLVALNFFRRIFYRVVSHFISIKIKDDQYFEKILQKVNDYVETDKRVVLLSACYPHAKRLSRMLGKKLKTKYTASHYLHNNDDNNSNEGVTLAFISNKVSHVDPPVVVILVTDQFYIDRLPIYIMSFEHRCYTTRYSERNGDFVFMDLKTGISEFCAGPEI